MLNQIFQIPFKPRRTYPLLKGQLPYWLIALLIAMAGVNYRLLFLAKDGVPTGVFWELFPTHLLQGIGIGIGITFVATLSIWVAGKIFKGAATFLEVLECLILSNIPDLAVFLFWMILLLAAGPSSFDLDLPPESFNTVAQLVYQMTPLVILVTLLWRLFLVVIILSEGQRITQFKALGSLLIAYFGMGLITTLANKYFKFIEF